MTWPVYCSTFQIIWINLAVKRQWRLSGCRLIGIILLTLIITSSNDVLKESVLGSHESPPPTWHSAGRLRTFFQSQKCHPLPPILTVTTPSLHTHKQGCPSLVINPAMKCWSMLIKTGRIDLFQSLYMFPLLSRKSLQSRLCRIPSLWEHIDTPPVWKYPILKPIRRTPRHTYPTLYIWNSNKTNTTITIYTICIIYSFTWIEVGRTNCCYIMYYIKSLLRSELEASQGQTVRVDIQGWTEGVDTAYGCL